MTRLQFCGMITLVTICVGCGGPTAYPVSGTVSYKGQPLADVNVTFLGKNGRIATASTDANGAFSFVTTYATGDGALAGEYRITISPKSAVIESENAPISYAADPSPLFPPRYASADTTDLFVTVEPGDGNRFNFELVD